MIPREILKKIRQIDLRTNRLVSQSVTEARLHRQDAGEKQRAFSVRCVKD